MPKIVNKEERRKEIALACSDLIHEVGIKKLTVSQVAKTAGIGKGTIYEYFENKEDIIFEIINIHIDKYHNEFEQNIKKEKTTRDKVLHFFKFAIDDSKENMKHFDGFKEYLSIVLSEENEQMLSFNCSCSSFFQVQLAKILQEGIQKGELKKEAIDLVEVIMVYERGLAITKMTQNDADVKVLCKKFIDNLFELVEVKKD
ncbi:TetR family transcriptional regulator [Malaciobacter halophilus]|uniref:TetR family transcriptional regulator n=1 Tax=Malaciobacter halophilus TaxID=197482 RepID=A0A2N1J3E7_9BACT|nr:TetR/AcrR family transcriptional regulator [Malaciobacter halophilus]AXH09123.1 transcriptional regulator, TetR/AcrR family [Malaciobacter halophilus]PKI81081.1 TetR family transcriptional regulator [Malaciobacter halophilus]